MPVIYHVDLEDTTGNVLAVIKNPIAFNYHIRTGGKGDHQFVMSLFDPVANLFGKDYLLRFYRKELDDLGNVVTDFTNVFTGIHKTYSESYLQSGNKTFTSYGPDGNEILEKAFIQYPPNSPQSNKTNLSTTVMIELVRENVGSLATVANGRNVDHVNPITIGGASGLGALWSNEMANKNLLTTLQHIRNFSRENGIHIDFETRYSGAYTWEFNCGNLYTDRTNYNLNPTTGRNGSGNVPVVFSTLYNNVDNMFISQSRYNTINTVTAIGKGTGILQESATAQNILDSLVSPISQRETIISGNNQDLSQLITTAEYALNEYESRVTINFTPILNTVRLWRDLFPGDFVTAITPRGEVFHLQLIEVNVEVSQSAGGSTIERLSLDFEHAIGFE